MTVFEGHFQQTHDLKFAVVISRFNILVTEKLLSACEDALKRHGIEVGPQSSQLDYAWVPGCFEIPMTARHLVLSNRYDAVICLGAVIRGQTDHYDHVASEVTKGIQALGFQTGVPVVFGVLTTDTMQQALERAGVKANLGWEYGMTAIEMANLTRSIRGPVLQTARPELLDVPTSNLH